MKRNESHRDAVRSEAVKRPRRKANAWNKVYNERKQRVRGLWERNGGYAAQIRIRGGETPVRWPLEHASTVPQAIEAMQALKKLRREGKLEVPGKIVGEPKASQSGQHTLKEAINAYKTERDTLDAKDVKTCERENSGLNFWTKKFGTKLLESVDDQMRIDFATWRKQEATKAGKSVSGRTIDLNIMAMNHVLQMAVRKKWLPRMPVGKWKKMAKKPAKVRLVSTQELETLCKTAIEACPLRGRQFSDYLRFLAYSGGREKESVAEEWSHVHWDRKQLEFPGGKKGGGSQEAGEPRFVDFYPKLVNHLQDMQKRRVPDNPFLFPAKLVKGQHAKSFKQIWKKVKRKTGILGGKDNIGFHHFRHYFISHCVMAGIDFKTIAEWVGHRDGGVLIGKVYGHLKPGHGAIQAEKIATEDAWK